MSESKDVAKRVWDWMQLHWDEHASISGAMEAAFDALNIAFAPPVVEGSVKVQVECCLRSLSDGGYEAEFRAAGSSVMQGATHRAVVEAWIPRVAPTPTVAGRVV